MNENKENSGSKLPPGPFIDITTEEEFEALIEELLGAERESNKEQRKENQSD